MASKSECYSCGKEADPNSPRNFCTECDGVFEDGKKHQEEVYARAYLLEEAKHNSKFGEDKDTAKARVGEIMGEIFMESMEAEEPSVAVSEPVSAATARKVEK